MARDLALFQTFLFLEFFFLLPSEKYNGSRYSKCMWTKILKCGWSHFKKPALAIFIGGLLFGTGTALSLLYFTQVGNVPYLVGPIFLSVGLMFLVTGLVWVPVIKQKMVHTAMTQMSHGRPLLPEQGIHTQSCVTIS
uniref:Uncharacterized protein n=1 Tax=Sinocyclocheilus grahami TaxID=75366 RepID=A0A672QCX7_SINGR